MDIDETVDYSVERMRSGAIMQDIRERGILDSFPSSDSSRSSDYELKEIITYFLSRDQ